jgi:UDP-3-O-[3-hydroxymyristoyl] glucosamine N-acyltransferase
VTTSDDSARFPVPTISAGRLRELVARPSKLIGDAARSIAAIAAIEYAASDTLCFCTRQDGALLETLKSLPRGAIVCVSDHRGLAAQEGLTLIASANPRLWFFEACSRITGNSHKPGVSAQAIVSQDATIDPSVAIDSLAVIETGVHVGANCRIGIGVRLLRGTILADNVTIQANSVVGSAGLASERDENGRHICMPHLAAVRIGAGTTIGAGTVVVRGTLRDTTIGADCLIGNHVNVGHNVTVGDRCLIGPMTVLGGSSTIGDDCWLSPSISVMNKIRIGDGAAIGIGSIVTRDVSAGEFAAGNPARPLPKLNKYNERS